LLDYFEAHRRARRLLYGLFASILLVVVLWVGIYPWWTQRNAISMARQWIAAGQLNYAAEIVQKALVKSPHQPELWLLASELARLNGQKSMEVEYARQAAQAKPGDSKYALEWAGAALRADQQDVAAQVLANVSEVELARSSIAQRLLGELARRQSRLEVAILHFEAALKIDGPGAIDELPLGLCLIAQSDAAQRQRGLGLLEKWTGDPEWGATALRSLLEDAVRRDARPAMLKWAAALRVHPRRTFGDVPLCLQALVAVDEGKFEEELLRLEQDHRASPEAAAQLVGWLNQIGQSQRALVWLQTLTEQDVQRPPLVLAKAEALRITGDWAALRSLTEKGDWGTELDFLRWAYGLLSARTLGEEKKAEELWRTLYGHALINSRHALFAGSAIYSWKLVDEAVALWWRAASQSGGVSYDALGALARYYQVQRDADGQYRVFSQLHSLRPQDDAVTNNYIFFAVLTGNRELQAEQLARDNLKRNPGNLTFLATYAYVLVVRNRAGEALRLVEPVVAKAGNLPAIQFAYGLALAASGDKEKARPILDSLPASTLTIREVELIAKLLNGDR
jgi:tetratricopeptide (TPR) repeat protein